MTRTILISVLLGTVLSGFEGAADASGPGMPGGQDHGHELHDSAHTGNHEQSDAADHDPLGPDDLVLCAGTLASASFYR